jgi:eukaryotic-like serine/threonine-protein kinase
VPPRPVVWVDRAAHEQPIDAPSRPYVYPRISPDGTRMVVSVADGDQNLWIWDFAHHTLARLTFESAANERYAAWSADGRTIFFALFDTHGIWRVETAGTGKAERLTSTGSAVYGVSPDGSSLVYMDGGATVDLMLLPLKGPKPVGHPLFPSPFNEKNAEISPDGRWVAYQSDESGQYEIYVRPFPAVETGRWQVSSSGGETPEWSRDGRELFYLAPKPATLMAVPVQPGPMFTFGQHKPVLDMQAYFAFGFGTGGRTYDVSLDGKRFLAIRNSKGAATADRTTLTIVTNWFTELQAKVK